MRDPLAPHEHDLIAVRHGSHLGGLGHYQRLVPGVIERPAGPEYRCERRAHAGCREQPIFVLLGDQCVLEDTAARRNKFRDMAKADD